MLVPYHFGFLAGDRNLQQLVVILIVEPQGPLSAFEFQIEARDFTLTALELHLLAAYRFQGDAHGQAILGNDCAKRYRSSRALQWTFVYFAILSQVAPGQQLAMAK